ncbi:MAG TPA: trypsin-like peptidase domain-containing protein [Candidatus Limnocylindrales bacterium]
MVSQPRRLGNRFVAFIASLVLVVMVAGACSSASTTTSTLVGAALSGHSTGVTTVPANLPAATSTTAPAIPAIPASGGAVALQDQFVAVIKQVSPSVVEIETSAGLGSGVIYDTKGDIVTNAHVVGTETTFTVTLSDGRSFPGTLVGTYAPDDIAVIRINATGLTTATFGDSSALSVGDFVLAMGNPLGLQSSVTEGIVSALGRQVSEPTGNALPDVIQTSAAINPGNSGGALVDLQGNIVGIPTLAATDAQVGGSAPGIGFAISSNRAKLIADQLIAGGKVTNSGRAYMGVQLRDGTAGPVVVAVTAGGPADKAGLVVGDIVLEIDSKATPDTGTLIEAVAAHHPGDTVQLKVQHRAGTTATVSLTLGQLPG